MLNNHQENNKTITTSQDIAKAYFATEADFPKYFYSCEHVQWQS